MKSQNTNEFQDIKQKITIFSKHLHWLDLKCMAETTSNMDFDGIDLTVRPQGHVPPEKVEDELPRAVETCQKAGIEIVMLCTSIQDVTHSTTEKILKTASQLEIKYFRTDWYHYDKAISIEKNLENL